MMEYSDESESESESDDPLAVTFTSVTCVGKPYSRYQGSYLFNLHKLLNEAVEMGVSDVVRWHRKIGNALEINWTCLTERFDAVHPVLVQYKLSRAGNRMECVRPTMNRKLREWKFIMVSACPDWVTYVYNDAAFGVTVTYGDLPTHRRQKPESST